jgi:hypothetical protein
MCAAADSYRVLMQHDTVAQKVDVGHPQRRGLTPTEAHSPELQHQRPIPSRLHRQAVQLGGCQVHIRSLGSSGQLYATRGIRGEHSIAHSVVEDARQQRVDSDNP